nr:DUF938 domain-containing protein [Lentibacter algarum]
MYAPSAAKNVEAISEVLCAHAPDSGAALEIASGTGQHVATLAMRIPQLHWQPTELDPVRRASIDAYATDINNIAPAVELNATAVGWHTKHQGQALITLANLLHLISEPEARTLIAEAGQALAPQGVLHLYGPFLRDGETTSEGDTSFHAKLQAEDPEVGYKDDWDIIEWIQASGMDLVEVIEMPANNMSFVARRVF